jgi:hypothetical protein
MSWRELSRSELSWSELSRRELSRREPSRCKIIPYSWNEYQGEPTSQTLGLYASPLLRVYRVVNRRGGNVYIGLILPDDTRACVQMQFRKDLKKVSTDHLYVVEVESVKFIFKKYDSVGITVHMVVIYDGANDPTNDALPTYFITDISSVESRERPKRRSKIVEKYYQTVIDRDDLPINDDAVLRGMEAIRRIITNAVPPSNDTHLKYIYHMHCHPEIKAKCGDIINAYIETGEFEEEFFNLKNIIIDASPYYKNRLCSHNVGYYKWLDLVVLAISKFRTSTREGKFIMYANAMWDLSYYMVPSKFDMQTVLPGCSPIEYRAIRLAMTFEGNCTLPDWFMIMIIAENSTNISIRNKTKLYFNLSIESIDRKSRKRMPNITRGDIVIPEGFYFETEYGKSWHSRINKMDDESIILGNKIEYGYFIYNSSDRSLRDCAWLQQIDVSEIPKELRPANCITHSLDVGETADEAAERAKAFTVKYKKYVTLECQSPHFYNGLYLVTYGVR